MTNPNLPTAAEALALAFELVRTPCSAAETARATALFEIARELRVAADMRVINARRFELDRERAADKLRAAGIIPSPSSYEPTPVMPYAGELAQARLSRLPDFAATQVITKPEPVIDEPTQYVPQVDAPTQRFEIVWSVGDKADCRHCHTPIIFEARRMQDPVTPDEGDPAELWIHKYTDQRVCATAPMGDEADGEVSHTFAAPSVGPAA